jgi:hypothetical protein
MIRLGAILTLALSFFAFPGALRAQQRPLAEYDITPLPGGSNPEYDMKSGFLTATNGVMVRYENAVMTAQ